VVDLQQLSVVYPGTTSLFDGIQQHGELLVDALAARSDVAAELFEGAAALAEVRRFGRGSDGRWLVVQYNPFVYGRAGFAPRWGMALWQTRAHRSQQSVAFVVHELAVPHAAAGWEPRAISRRAQLRALLPVADVVFTAVEAYAHALRAMTSVPVVQLPVGSMLKRIPAAEAADQHAFVLGTLALGQTHLHLTAPVLRAAARVRQALDVPVRLLVLGAGARPPVPEPKGVEVVCPGPLDDHALATALASVDIFLAPLLDGVSARRSAVMAALQQGLAIVGTDGPLTDNALRARVDALVLVPVTDENAFAAAVGDLAVNPERRAALGIAARGLYSTQFAWPVIAKRMVTTLKMARVAV
jgi:hypothetical protein